MLKMAFFNESPEVKAINQQLQADKELAQYPYHFRVITINDGIATVTSPRSAQLSVLHAMKIIHPDYANKDPDSPEMINAQKELGRLQEKAADIIKAAPEVSSIKWQIDKAWFDGHGIDISYMLN